ncbi:MAG TPA: hypothetical protein DDY68_00110 [Porphyromonadaceae bacterium]|nr:hypothetical protein [Porphyromonadaceae bacterium]
MTMAEFIIATSNAIRGDSIEKTEFSYKTISDVKKDIVEILQSHLNLQLYEEKIEYVANVYRKNKGDDKCPEFSCGFTIKDNKIDLSQKKNNSN